MLHKDFHDFLSLLAKHKVRYLIVGGYAVAVHGYPRYTGDLDIFIALDEQTAAAMADAFHEFGFSREELDARLFLEPKNIVEVGREPLKIHVMNAIAGVPFDEAYKKKMQVNLDGLDVPFIGFEDLIRNKSSTGRGKDQVDADELIRRRESKKSAE